MRLTLHSDLALRVLMHLALTGENRATIQGISQAFGVSRNHLMKVANELARLGYVDSSRGSGGGLRLNRSPADIVIGRVVRDMEADFGLVECFREDNRCVITPACALPRMLDKALKAFLETLDAFTLADLIEGERADQMAAILKIRLD